MNWGDKLIEFVNSTAALHLGLYLLISIIATFIIVPIIINTAKKTKNTLDDIFLTKRVLRELSFFLPLFLFDYSKTRNFLLFVIGARVISNLINSGVEFYSHFPISKKRPIKGYAQLLKIVLWIMATICVGGIILDKSPWKLLAALGTVSAVLLLIFKDTILGLTASFQLTMNDMVHVGDWIVLPGKCDGDVIDISLHTVKVQNWDKTISTVPTYALINESFVNWRGMSEADGRRIKRSINIDMNSIKFLDNETLENLKHVNLIKDYLKGKLPQVSESNSRILEDAELSTNQRRLTNIGTFRVYIENFLKTNPMINQDMTFLVRQLQPTSEGLPLEIYIFCKDKVWANYEAVQADIFDHLLAIIPEFDLRVYQSPTGYDFGKLNNK